MGLPLVSLKHEPYRVESISILPYDKDSQQMQPSSAQHIVSVSQSIITYQLHTLRSVTIRNIGHCMIDIDQTMSSVVREQFVNVPAYMALFPLLSQLLKQPQFEALVIDKIPFKTACELIVKFLTTPTSHKQSLTINKAIKDTNNNPSNVTLSETKQPPTLAANSQSFPETNTQYKYLDLRHSCSSLLSNLPELKLKKLTISLQEMTYDLMIQVEHIAFLSPPFVMSEDMLTISSRSAHLEKLVFSSPILKRLEFTFTSPRITQGLLPALNQCLSVLYQQGRGLDEIILNSVRFDNCDHMKEFFIRVRDLSHDHGTTLVISASDTLLVQFITGEKELFKIGERSFNSVQISTQEDESRLFDDLRNDFQEKKIKKIVFTAYENNESHLLLEPLTERLVVQPSF